MIKIFLTVRNRLAITKKCITAIRKHSTLPYQLYVYNNQTSYKIEEHFTYFMKLYKNKQVTQITFNTDASTFNAFSKGSTCNFFGRQHEEDPMKDKYSFLVMLDNDIIVTPGWDTKLLAAWKYVNENNIDNIKVIGQLPGGIKQRTDVLKINPELQGKSGKLGGSGLWSVKPNFFRNVGFLDLKLLVGHNKKHDQLYWRLLDRASKGKPYILGLRNKLGIHCGKMTGSVCNKLTRGRSMEINKKLKTIEFENADKKINALSFDEFFKLLINNKNLQSDW